MTKKTQIPVDQLEGVLLDYFVAIAHWQNVHPKEEFILDHFDVDLTPMFRTNTASCRYAVGRVSNQSYAAKFIARHYIEKVCGRTVTLPASLAHLVEVE